MLLFCLIVLLLNFSHTYSNLSLRILPIESSVILQENADLNLTCKVITKYHRHSKFDLTWMLPTRSHSSFSDRVTVFQGNDQLTVTIHNLQEDDTGIYVCKLQDNGIVLNKKISVLVRTKKCASPFFDCGGGLCISKHYACDGYVDCPSGYDESFKFCGPDACNGKVFCDGRCISKELCCDPLIDINCSVSYVMPCCSNIVPSEENSPLCTSPENCQGGHYAGFGNSILYIVASCAGVLMVVSMMIMFLACRLCSRHSDELHRWARIPATDVHRRYHQPDSDSTDVNFFFEDPTPEGFQSSSSDDFVLLNFVPGVGFEIADCGPKPPPYTENVTGIPPPPYESRIDLSKPDMIHSDMSPVSDACE